MKKNTTSYEALLAIVTGCLILYFVFDRLPVFLYTALALGLAGLLSKRIAAWIDWAWTKLTRAIGFVMTHLLLSIVFFFLLFPIAMLYRLFGKNEMILKNPEKSVFKVRDHVYEAKDLEKPW